MKRCFSIFLAVLLASAAYSQNLEKKDSLEKKSLRLNDSFFSPTSFHEFIPKKTDSAHTNNFGIKLRPKVDYSVAGGPSQTGRTNLTYYGYLNAGAQLEARNLRAQLNYELLGANMGTYISNFVDSVGIYPGFGVAKRNDIGHHVHRITGRLNFQFSRHFNAEIGNHTNFWGRGYRSMVLGEHMAPYPYLKLTTEVWKIKYVNLFMQLKAFRPETDFSNTRTKYVAMHAIDFDVSETFSFTIYESVVWQASDTLSNRNFELNYLNPVIFYRPVEFAQGSADNVLLGVAFKLKLDKHVQWYGQLFLDEFLLSEVTGRTGWWANKVGVQLGVQMADVIPEVWAYSELNAARPFTYTHGSVLQNYGHLNQSLAHPLTTNFYEWSSGAQFEKGDWAFTGRFNWALYGRDIDTTNYGGTIFSETTAPFRTRGNYIGQGNTHHSYILQLTASKKMSKKRNLFAIGSYTWRHVKSNFQTENEHLLTIGIGSKLYRLDRRRSQGGMPQFSQDF